MEYRQSQHSNYRAQEDRSLSATNFSKKSNSNPPEEAINRFRGTSIISVYICLFVLYSCDKDEAALADWGSWKERTYLLHQAWTQWKDVVLSKARHWAKGFRFRLRPGPIRIPRPGLRRNRETRNLRHPERFQRRPDGLRSNRFRQDAHHLRFETSRRT